MVAQQGSFSTSDQTAGALCFHTNNFLQTCFRPYHVSVSRINKILDTTPRRTPLRAVSRLPHIYQYQKHLSTHMSSRMAILPPTTRSLAGSRWARNPKFSNKTSPITNHRAKACGIPNLINIALVKSCATLTLDRRWPHFDIPGTPYPISFSSLLLARRGGEVAHAYSGRHV